MFEINKPYECDKSLMAALGLKSFECHLRQKVKVGTVTPLLIKATLKPVLKFPRSVRRRNSGRLIQLALTALNTCSKLTQVLLVVIGHMRLNTPR